MATSNLKEFIRRAQSKHGKRYDYSAVVYEHCQRHVRIRCPDHGEFLQTPSNHLKHTGCVQCAFAGKVQTAGKQFIEAAKAKYGRLFDYSKTVYTGAFTKVIIKCPLHGDFQQTPGNHLKYGSCPTCREHAPLLKFLAFSKAKHGSKFDYANVTVQQIKSGKPISIGCPIHGQIKLLAYTHTHEHGCLQCLLATRRNKRAKQFLLAAYKLYGDKFDYSQTRYTGADKYITIICRKHGAFSQIAKNHLHYVGCPQCTKSYQQTSKESKFLALAKHNHGEKYDYSKVKYIAANLPVSILCPQHGIFTRTPKEHITKGCPKCTTRKRQTNVRARATSTEVITKFKRIHGNRYDYAKVINSGDNQKVTISCSLHGEFLQTPRTHLKGSGCPKCGRTSIALDKQLTTDEFIARATKRHQGFYCYKKTTYAGYSQLLTIKCPLHGDFTTPAITHLKTGGCKGCHAKARGNKFIKTLSKRYQDKYTYDKVNYVNSTTEVLITCKKHGDFRTTPDLHLLGKGHCLKCLKEAKTSSFSKAFFLRAKQIHGARYDYSQVVYKSATNKIQIGCKKHGFFLQTPNGHLNKQGCPKCGNNTLTQEEFITKAKAIHNDKYNYAKVCYTNQQVPIIITCPLHGDFTQQPSTHLRNSGCPQCRTSKGETTIALFLKDHKIPFLPRTTFPTCKNPKTGCNLYYDFYLPNVKVLIEYDGYQHFAAYFKDKDSKDSLKKRQYRDRIKTKWAKDNGYQLLRLDYRKFHRLEKELTTLLPTLTHHAPHF